MSVHPELFVRKWETSKDAGATAKALGITRKSAVQQAIRYRKKGVRLKLEPTPKPVGRPRIDVKMLNRIVREIATNG